MSAMYATYSTYSTLASANCDDSGLEVTWQDGASDRWPYIWLRHACSCDGCGTSLKGVRPRFADRPGHTASTPAVRISNGQLHIDWGGSHRSTFEGDWLRAHRLSDEARSQRRTRPELWSGDLDLPEPLQWPDVSHDAAMRLDLLLQVRDRGFALISGVPTDTSKIDSIAALIGPRRRTNYNRGIYELRAKRKPEITGDMAVPLDPHTDEMYRSEPPAITLFQIIKAAASGGHSTLIDGLQLAARLQAEAPEAFETLTSLPARFHRELDDGHIFEMQAPILATGRWGEVTGIRFNDRCMAPVDATFDDVIRFYDAVEVWFSMITSGRDTLEIPLESGEMLVFNNQRVLHGRTAFDAESGRHVRSFHVELDEFHSTLRACLRKMGDPDEWMILGAMARP